MNRLNNHTQHDEGRMYRVIIRESVDEEMADWFGGMDVKVQDGVTVLEGMLIDQSELQGLLRKIHDLHLTLISVETLSEKLKEKKGTSQ